MSEVKKGKKASLVTRQKMSLFHKGKKAWFIGLPKERMPHYGKPHSQETKEKLSIIHKNNHANSSRTYGFKKGNQCLKGLKKKLMSSLEIKFQQIVQKNNLPYKFVGNGEVIIGRKCPDFVNTNGENIAIEVYATAHKLKIGQAKNKTIELWQQERQEIFNKYGWKIEFFNETQIREEEVLRRIG